MYDTSLSLTHNVRSEVKSSESIHTTVDANTSLYHQSKSETTNTKSYKWQIVWRNVIWYFTLHAFTVYGFYLGISRQVYLKTLIFMIILISFSTLGITAGAHRLWSHRSYTARLPVRILLTVFQTLAGQNHIHEWVRDHRVHHKYVDTDADPHNSTRGFFFSHIGWLLIRKHPMVKLHPVDMTDIESDSVVMFQKKHYLWLMPLITFLIPSLIPHWFWDERFWYSFVVVGITRYIISLNFTWLVNSAAHMWGTRPYDKNITAKENDIVSFLVLGEGWHNYHHIFPWDYKTGEFGNYRLNLTTEFINICATVGLVYDLKTAMSSIIEKRSDRTGDGTRQHHSIKIL